MLNFTNDLVSWKMSRFKFLNLPFFAAKSKVILIFKLEFK